MFLTPSAGTLYDRVTKRGIRPSMVLSGMGSYRTLGGPSHRPHQRTVYASDDPLVAIAEMAYYGCSPCSLSGANPIGGASSLSSCTGFTILSPGYFAVKSGSAIRSSMSLSQVTR
jgi:hypothetical protein